jgi:hypothetical protein
MSGPVVAGHSIAAKTAAAPKTALAKETFENQLNNARQSTLNPEIELCNPF